MPMVAALSLGTAHAGKPVVTNVVDPNDPLQGAKPGESKKTPGGIVSGGNVTPTSDNVPARPNVLDAVFYSAQYPDLRRFGTDKMALQDHWDKYGRNEGRAPNREGYAALQDYNTWAAGCRADKWGQVQYSRGKGGTLLYRNLCEPLYYKVSLAFHMQRPPRSGNGSDHLRVSDYLKQGEYLVSNNKRFFAALQPDGNFCIYDGASPASPHGGAKWCTLRQSAGAGPFFAVQQNDGNFCVYRGTQPGDSKGGVFCVFNVPQAGQPYYYAVLQDDANFAIHRGASPANEWGHVWDRVTSTPPAPDTGWETFLKDLKAAQASVDQFQSQMDASRAQLYTPGLAK
jgi:hypothetical protein